MYMHWTFIQVFAVDTCIFTRMSFENDSETLCEILESVRVISWNLLIPYKILKSLRNPLKSQNVVNLWRFSNIIHDAFNITHYHSKSLQNKKVDFHLFWAMTQFIKKANFITWHWQWEANTFEADFLTVLKESSSFLLINMLSIYFVYDTL